MSVTAALAPALVLERDADSRSISFNFTVLQLHVELDDFGDPEVSQGLAGPRNRGGCRLLPGFGAGSDEFDDFIDIFRPDIPPLLNNNDLAAESHIRPICWGRRPGLRASIPEKQFPVQD
jgi:hypothetical protein